MRALSNTAALIANHAAYVQMRIVFRRGDMLTSAEARTWPSSDQRTVRVKPALSQAADRAFSSALVT
jgi:hypothetical protein